jgi:hypothetical protein
VHLSGPVCDDRPNVGHLGEAAVTGPENLSFMHLFNFRIPHLRFRSAWLLLLALLGTVRPALGAAVDEDMARTVAQRFLAAHAGSFVSIQPGDLQLAYSMVDTAVGQQGTVVYFRVFNAVPHGFVIVAGDDLVTPVLGYSTEGSFPSGTLPRNVAKWLEGYQHEIRAALDAGGPADHEVSGMWQRWTTAEAGNDRGGGAVGPLLQTLWDQSPNVNAQCPGGSVTGCVATAMAQVMKYHDHPVNGEGFHSYNAPNYGTLSANFAGTTYAWANMPNVVSGPNAAVATLMYHCGVSVDMQYSPQVSNAYVLSSQSPIQNCAEYALKTYFGYSTTMQGVLRDNYGQSQWIDLLKGELDAGRPVIYAGFGSGGGHCFVCDGYDNNDYFHFNWGWGGQVNGYFIVDALDPGSTGTGGGAGGYNSGQQALIGIQPEDSGGETTTNVMALYDYVMPSASTLYYGQAFSVTTNILNNGTNDFSGDYAAGIFDAASNFYGFVEELDGYTLPAGYVYNTGLEFSTTGLFSMLPGTYHIGIMYRSTGGEWVLVANNGGYTNLPEITVINPNSIELNSEMSVSPGTTVVEGGPISVDLNVLNDGNTTFFGQYGVALYNLDGSWAQDIGTINENNGLPSGYTYLAPYLTFGPVDVTVAPGTYLLAIEHNPNSMGWQLTGSSYFSNPIFVNVVAAGLSPDQYEANNTMNQAYSLPANFSGNSASTNTTGSNLHNGTDQDFYKVVLPAGNNYAITARLHDAYNSGNGNTYSVDGLWSYSMDGSSWSTAYDDIMPGSIVVNGGGTVWFHVAPYFAGDVGTYMLQLDIQRGPNVGLDEHTPIGDIRLFPNPARNTVTLDLSRCAARMTDLELFDMEGRSVQHVLAEPRTDALYSMDVSGLKEGVYVLHLTTNAGVRAERFVIAR